VAAVLLALAEPRITVYETKVAAGILVDTSASLSEQDLARASSLAGQIESARGSRWTRVIPFARAARNAAPEEHAAAWKLKIHSRRRRPRHQSRSRVARRRRFPSGGHGTRLALISDGNENLAASCAALGRHGELGIPIDTFPTRRPAETKPAPGIDQLALAGFSAASSSRSISL